MTLMNSLPHFLMAALSMAALQLHIDDDDEIVVPLTDEVQFTYRGEPIAVNDVIWIETLCYGLQPGYVQTICDNPYYGQSGLCAYVVSMPWEPSWTEYLNLEVSVS